MPCLGVQLPGVQLRMLSELPTLGSWRCVWTGTPLAWVALGFITSSGTALDQPLRLDIWTSVLGGFVKNLLSLALFTGLTAGSSSVCQQLQMEAGSVAVGWAGPGWLAEAVHGEQCAGRQLPHVLWCGAWGFLTRCQSGCVPVCAKHASLHHPRCPSAHFYLCPSEFIVWVDLRLAILDIAQQRGDMKL